jgi:hypothetical protein
VNECMDGMACRGIILLNGTELALAGTGMEWNLSVHRAR